MAWCESEDIDYIFGLAQNPRLQKLIEAQMAQAEKPYEETKTPARVFPEFFYATEKTWGRERRVIAKAEHLGDLAASRANGGAGVVREGIRRARRLSGKPYQRATVGSVCGSYQHRQDVVQPTAAALLFNGLCPAANAAARGVGGHRVGKHAVIGPFGERVNSLLHGRRDPQFDNAASRLGVQAAAQRVQETVEHGGGAHALTIARSLRINSREVGGTWCEAAAQFKRCRVAGGTPWRHLENKACPAR